MSGPFLVKRSFHFYAAHRNEDLPTQRCFNIHGHTYFVDCTVESHQLEDRSYSVLFSDIERRVQAILDDFEHSMLINRNDPYFPTLEGLGTKLCVFDVTPSAENVCRIIFERIRDTTGLNVVQVDLRETTTSVVSYRG